MKNCNFCLDNKLLKGKILAQDEYCYIVESIDPVLKNAVMIITKRHAKTPFELNNNEWQSVQKFLSAAKIILDKTGPDGYNIGWNVEKIAGQNIPHAHLHIVARFSDEPLSGKGICYFFKQESNKRK